MAIIRSTSMPSVILDAARSIFQQKRDQLREAIAKRKIYNATWFELAALSDRELSDLGIPRCNIKRLAMEAAYGC